MLQENWHLFNYNYKVDMVVWSFNAAYDWYRMHVLRKCCQKQITPFFVKRILVLSGNCVDLLILNNTDRIELGSNLKPTSSIDSLSRNITMHRSHFSNVCALSMIFDTTFSTEVCSSKTSCTTSNNAWNEQTNSYTFKLCFCLDVLIMQVGFNSR